MGKGDVFERIFDSCHMLVAYLDPHCNFLQVNRAYAEADGRPPDFFPGRNHFELYPDAENEAIFRRVAATGEPHTAWGRPFRYKDHPERGTTWWDWTLEAVRDGCGAVEGLILTLVDVSARVRAEAERDEARRNQKVLDRLLRLGLENLALEEMLRRTLRIIATVPFMELDAKGAIFLTGKGGTYLELAAAHGLPDCFGTECGMVDIGQCLCGNAAADRELLFAAAGDDRHHRPQGTVPHAHYCVPILSGEDLLGVLTLFLREDHAPAAAEQRFLRAVADVLAAIILNRKLADDRERARQAQAGSETRLRSLLRLFRQLEKASGPDDIIGPLLEEIRQIVGYNSTWMYLFDENLHTARLFAAGGAAAASLRERVPAMAIRGDAFLEEIAAGSHVVLVEDARTDPRTDKRIVARLDNRTIVNLPMAVDGKVLGAIGTGTFGEEGPRPPATEELEYLETMARQVAVVVERIRFLDQRRQMEESLRGSEQRLQALLEAAPDAIVSSDADGSILWWNRAAARIFGYRAEEIQGRPLTGLLPAAAHPAYRRALEEARRREGSTLPGGHDLVALAGLRKDGQEFPLELSLAIWGEGRQRYVTAILRDVTARKKLEEQYLQAQKMEAVGRLTGGVAHDFNNLLSCVIGYTDLALRDAAIEGQTRASLEIVHEAGRKAADLTRQLLAFSRKQVLEVRPVSLNQTVADFLKLLGKTIGEDIEIVPRTGAVSDVILADRGQLEQVLMNLAVNARDAMPDGGRLFIETADLAVEAGGGEAEDGIAPGVYVVLEVRDTGVGMSRETLSRIFDPFFTTKGAGHGTGLGLATVSGIVGQHKGYIRAVSEPGRGACFRVFWPAAAAEAEAAEGAGAAAGPERCGGGKVLVVDDDEHVRQLVCDVLENHGCRCMAAASGEEALAIPPEKLREVDLVMTDVIMSGMNGREMAQRIRQRHPAAAIVFMSGYTDEVITRHGVLEEGVHFLPKPLSVSAILAKVNEVLAGS